MQTQEELNQIDKTHQSLQPQITTQACLDPRLPYPFGAQKRYEGKIIYPCIMAKESSFAYEEQGFFAPAPANIITGKEEMMKYLTGLLNSKLIYFAMRKFYMGGGIEGELKTNNLLKIPIPAMSSQTTTRQIITLVDEILHSKAKDPKTDIQELESRIDDLVYKLYNLSESEINIIEG